MLQYLQRIGKAIMLPIAALPVAGILLGVGGSLINIAALENAPAIYQPLIAFVNIPMITIILKIMQGIGDIVFGNLPVLFAVGTAVGLAKQDKGTAALASVFGFLIMNQVIGVLLGVGATPVSYTHLQQILDSIKHLKDNVEMTTLDVLTERGKSGINILITLLILGLITNFNWSIVISFIVVFLFTIKDIYSNIK